MSSRLRSTLSAGACALAMLACLAVAALGSRAFADLNDSTIVPTAPDLPSASPVPAGQNAISPADSQRIATRFERMRRSTGVTIFQVDGYYAHCRPWSFPQDRVIDCHRIIQEVPAPSRAWRDSIVALLTAPGALIPPRLNLCQCSDDVVLRFESESETTTVWLCTGCATVGIPTPTAVMGFDFAPGRSLLQWWVNAALQRVEYKSQQEFEYYDTLPELVTTPELPRALQVGAAAHADTVVFEALIGKDGRVSQLLLKRGSQGLADLAGPYVGRYVYRPALGGGRPVAAMIHISIPVPKGTR